jgi:hypothetical protein
MSKSTLKKRLDELEQDKGVTNKSNTRKPRSISTKDQMQIIKEMVTVEFDKDSPGKIHT